MRRAYAHHGSTRHHSDEVEYRVAQHLDKLGERLRRLGFVTGNVTGGEALLDKENRAATKVSAGDELPEWARRRVPGHGRVNARPLAPEGPGHTKIPSTSRRERARTSRVGPARLERATSCSGGKRSIQLSYGP